MFRSRAATCTVHALQTLLCPLRCSTCLPDLQSPQPRFASPQPYVHCDDDLV